MVRVQRVLRSWRAAKAAPVQAELWEPLHHGPPTALRYPLPARVHTDVSAPALLPLGSQLGLEQGRPAAPAHEKQADVEANIAQVLFEMIRIMLSLVARCILEFSLSCACCEIKDLYWTLIIKIATRP